MWYVPQVALGGFVKIDRKARVKGSRRACEQVEGENREIEDVVEEIVETLNFDRKKWSWISIKTEFRNASSEPRPTKVSEIYQPVAKRAKCAF